MRTAAVLAAGALAACAQQPATPSGYEFDRPHLLARQVVWGIAHGVHLLGRACTDSGDRAAAMAYADWMDREKLAILAAGRDLARHYFDREAASPEALAAALNLKTVLELPPDELASACATLPEALAGARYDLGRVRAEYLKAALRGNPAFRGAIWNDP